jgi:hypothetical protein
MAHWSHRFLVVLVVAVGALAAAPGGASAEGWLPTVDAAVVPGAGAGDVAVDAQGNATVVGTRPTVEPDRSVAVMTRPAGGQWSALDDISALDGLASDPKVAVDPHGNAVVVWSARSDLLSGTITVATRSAGGAWSAPFDLSGVVRGASDQQVAVDAAGNATVIWSQISAGGNGYVVRTASRPLGGAWSAPVDLSAGPTSSGPQLAVAPDGSATAVWILHEPVGTSWTVQAKSRPAGGLQAWSAAANLTSDGRSAEYPRVAVDAQGRATVAWSFFDGSGSAVRAVHRSAGGAWSLPVDVTDDPGQVSSRIALAVDPQGNATAVWGSFKPGDGYVVRSSRRPPGGAWGAPVDLSAPDGSPGFILEPDPQVVVDPQGNVNASWHDFGSSRLRTAHRPTGGAWSAPVDLTAAGDLAITEMAVDPQGNVTAMWIGTNGSGETVVRSRVFDVGPLLRDVAVPASAVVGQRVGMSVDPLDLWSPVATSWAFGDGGSGSGAAVGHCYSSPGERTVTISSTDQAANTTTTSRTITIEPNPALAGKADPCNDPGPGPGPGPDRHPGPYPGLPPIRIAPVVSGLKQSNASWRTRAGNRKPRLPVGTTFRFRLDRSARVRFEFSQIVPGRRAKSRCVKPTMANRKRPTCSRYQTRGTLDLAGRAGKNAYAFRGKIHRRSLAPGQYRLRVTALADGKRSAAVTLRFTIAR